MTTQPTMKGFFVMVDSSLKDDEIEAKISVVREITGVISVTPIVDILEHARSILGLSCGAAAMMSELIMRLNPRIKDTVNQILKGGA